MFQRTFVISDKIAFEQACRSVADDPRYVSCRACLVVLFEPAGESALRAEAVETMRMVLPGARLAGMTTLGPVVPEADVPHKPSVSFLCFERGSFDVCLYACEGGDAGAAARAIGERVSAGEQVRGVMLLASGRGLDLSGVFEVIEAQHPGLPVFGAQAGAEALLNGHSKVFADGGECAQGVAAVVFRGESLEISSGSSLGWRPVGREMKITACRKDGSVSTIDGETATDVYRRYLGVEPGDSFYADACAFPLLAMRSGEPVAHAPARFGHDGSILFPAAPSVGTCVTFSYTKPEYLLRDSLKAANDIVRFAPQALLLFCSVSRRVCMGNDRAGRELSYYRRACPSLGLSYGFGEVVSLPGGAALTNCCIAAVAFREGALPEGFEAEAIADPELAGEAVRYPVLSDRLATFLEATTAELAATIEELEHLAHRDHLTGVFNRRHFDEVLANRLENHRRSSDQGAALIMYDIDHFKVVNDTYGHEVGDAVLKELTARVKGAIREDDVMGRWGGEEFLVLVSGITLEHAFSLAERIRACVAAQPFPGVGAVTISLGVTRVHDDDTRDTLFARVDKALYRAKDDGRNRVASFD